MRNWKYLVPLSLPLLFLTLTFPLSSKAKDDSTDRKTSSLHESKSKTANGIDAAMNDRCREILGLIDASIKLANAQPSSISYSFELIGKQIKSVKCANSNKNESALKRSTIEHLNLKEIKTLAELDLKAELSMKDKMLSLSLYDAKTKRHKVHQLLFYSDCKEMKAAPNVLSIQQSET